MHELKQVKISNMAAYSQMYYDIVLKDETREIDMIDLLR